MKVSTTERGRLGNAIFRYLASALYCIFYKAEKIYNNNSYIDLSDADFVRWKNIVESGNIPVIASNNYRFNDYYQHDKIYIKYLSELKEYIQLHPSEELHTDDGKVFYSIQLLEDQTAPKYDIVMHLRLEDFITYGLVMHPMYLKELLIKNNITNVCIVMNKASNELEYKYINYLKKFINCTIESNDIITDYHIMQNAKTLICSNSTLSWAAALFSTVITTVYMPNYPANRIHETFRAPIENTIAYDYKSCNKEELEIFLENYSAI
jgi:hypothetical protein